MKSLARSIKAKSARRMLAELVTGLGDSCSDLFRYGRKDPTPHEISVFENEAKALLSAITEQRLLLDDQEEEPAVLESFVSEPPTVDSFEEGGLPL